MAYDPRNLSVLAYANGFTLWHYATEDAATTADDAGYFNDAADMLRVGDMLLANVDTAGTTPSAGVLVVVSSAGGSVDVANMTPFGNSNAD